MQQQSVQRWLDDLGSSAPAPGGGPAAAMSTAIGAAVVEMVCNLTIGRPRYADHEATMTAARDRATRLRAEALRLAEADEAAFGAVAVAYRLPKSTDDEQRARHAAIQTALVAAAEVPLSAARVAADVIALAGSIVEISNVTVLSDVAVAAATARAGLDAAIVNVEVNLAATADPDRRAALAAALRQPAELAGEADRIIAEVRKKIFA